ncbi:hypothetical protein HDU96_008267 [Phlyctochytrium bullatum]|nr:hypothetical protein HDU96_008267 [Phlyctochytrium bullatum]
MSVLTSSPSSHATATATATTILRDSGASPPSGSRTSLLAAAPGASTTTLSRAGISDMSELFDCNSSLTEFAESDATSDDEENGNYDGIQLPHSCGPTEIVKFAIVTPSGGSSAPFAAASALNGSDRPSVSPTSALALAAARSVPKRHPAKANELARDLEPKDASAGAKQGGGFLKKFRLLFGKAFPAAEVSPDQVTPFPAAEVSPDQVTPFPAAAEVSPDQDMPPHEASSQALETATADLPMILRRGTRKRILHVPWSPSENDISYAKPKATKKTAKTVKPMSKQRQSGIKKTGTKKASRKWAAEVKDGKHTAGDITLGGGSLTAPATVTANSEHAQETPNAISTPIDEESPIAMVLLCREFSHNLDYPDSADAQDSQETASAADSVIAVFSRAGSPASETESASLVPKNDKAEAESEPESTSLALIDASAARARPVCSNYSDLDGVITVFSRAGSPTSETESTSLVAKNDEAEAESEPESTSLALLDASAARARPVCSNYADLDGGGQRQRRWRLFMAGVKNYSPKSTTLAEIQAITCAPAATANSTLEAIPSASLPTAEQLRQAQSAYDALSLSENTRTDASPMNVEETAEAVKDLPGSVEDQLVRNTALAEYQAGFPASIATSTLEASRADLCHNNGVHPQRGSSPVTTAVEDYPETNTSAIPLCAAPMNEEAEAESECKSMSLASLDTSTAGTPEHLATTQLPTVIATSKLDAVPAGATQINEESESESESMSLVSIDTSAAGTQSLVTSSIYGRHCGGGQSQRGLSPFTTAVRDHLDKSMPVAEFEEIMSIPVAETTSIAEDFPSDAPPPVEKTAEPVEELPRRSQNGADAWSPLEAVPIDAAPMDEERAVKQPVGDPQIASEVSKTTFDSILDAIISDLPLAVKETAEQVKELPQQSLKPLDPFELRPLLHAITTDASPMFEKKAAEAVKDVQNACKSARPGTSKRKREPRSNCSLSGNQNAKKRAKHDRQKATTAARKSADAGRNEEVRRAEDSALDNPRDIAKFQSIALAPAASATMAFEAFPSDAPPAIETAANQSLLQSQGLSDSMPLLHVVTADATPMAEDKATETVGDSPNAVKAVRPTAGAGKQKQLNRLLTERQIAKRRATIDRWRAIRASQKSAEEGRNEEGRQVKASAPIEGSSEAVAGDLICDGVESDAAITRQTVVPEVEESPTRVELTDEVTVDIASGNFVLSEAQGLPREQDRLADGPQIPNLTAEAQTPVESKAVGSNKGPATQASNPARLKNGACGWRPKLNPYFSSRQIARNRAQRERSRSAKKARMKGSEHANETTLVEESVRELEEAKCAETVEVADSACRRVTGSEAPVLDSLGSELAVAENLDGDVVNMIGIIAVSAIPVLVVETNCSDTLTNVDRGVEYGSGVGPGSEPGGGTVIPPNAIDAARDGRVLAAIATLENVVLHSVASRAASAIATYALEDDSHETVREEILSAQDLIGEKRSPPTVEHSEDIRAFDSTSSPATRALGLETLRDGPTREKQESAETPTEQICILDTVTFAAASAFAIEALEKDGQAPVNEEILVCEKLSKHNEPN